jgi:hypothetical protein
LHCIICDVVQLTELAVRTRKSLRNGGLRVVSAAAILLVSAQLVTAGDTPHSAVLGKWKIRINGGGEIYTSFLTLEADESSGLQGRYESEGRRSRIESAELKGNMLTVVVSTQRFARPVTATFTCDMSEGSMTGEVDMDSGSSANSYDFKGTRISRPASLATPPPAAEPPVPVAEASAAAAEVPAAVEQTVQFQRTENGYDKVVDAEIWAIAPSKSLLGQGTMTADGNNGGGESQVLLQFNEIFGNADGQIPRDVHVVNARLRVVAFDPGTTCYLHRLLVPWTPAVTWDGMVNGISVDNVEATTVRDGFTFGEINMDRQLVDFDVTETVQAWADGAENFGWVFVNTGGNGWDFYSSDWIEPEFRPSLSVTFRKR